MNFKRTCFLITFIFPLIFTGCWDKVEIDKKAFISTIAIDAGEDIGKSKEFKKLNSDEPFPEDEIKKINVNFGFPKISEMVASNGTSASEEYIKVEAYSMQDAVDKMVTKSSRSVNLGHTMLILLSSDLLEYPDIVKEIVDYLQREPTINRMMQVVITEGTAEDFLKFKPGVEQNLQSYINGIMENSKKNSTIIPMKLNKLLIFLSESGNAIAPKLSYDKTQNEISVNGIGIIKDYKLIGFLSKGQTSALQIMRAEVKGSKESIYLEGHPLDYEIDNIDREIRMEEKDGKLVFNIEVDVEGAIKGYYMDKKLLDTKKLSEIEQNFNKVLKKECEKVAKTTQQEYNVDIMGLREYVEKFHPKIWNKYKDNWSQKYKDSIINVDINTKIRRIGVTE